MAKKKTEYFDVLSPRARLSYPHFDKPEKFKEKNGDIKEGKFCATLLFCTAGKDANGKGVVDLSAMEKVAVQAAESMFGPRDKWDPKLKKNFKWPFKNGNEEAKEGEIPEGYKDMTFIKAGSKDQPGMVNLKRQNIEFSVKPSEKTIYAGCFVRASLTAAAFDVDGGRGVTFYLKNVQKLEDGPSFTSRTSAADEFDDSLSEKNDEAEEFDDMSSSGGSDESDEFDLSL